MKIIMLAVLLSGCAGVISVDKHQEMLNKKDKQVSMLRKELESLQPSPEALNEKLIFSTYIKNEWAPKLTDSFSDAIKMPVQIKVMEFKLLDDFKFAVVACEIKSPVKAVKVYAYFNKDPTWNFIGVNMFNLPQDAK